MGPPDAHGEPMAVRSMTAHDLGAVRDLTNAAFRLQIARLTGRDLPERIFADLLFDHALAADPDGCLVAEAPGGDGVVGALLSACRGASASFGPVATRPQSQQRGAGRALVTECLRRWDERAVAVRGLETFANSDYHVRFYASLGFRAAWTGIGFFKSFSSSGQTAMPEGVEVDGALPDLGFCLAGLDLGAEARATQQTGAGEVLVTQGGMASLHLRPTFQGPGVGFVPFLAAADRPTFDRLLAAAEHRCASAGLTALFTRACGSAFDAIDALGQHGYAAGTAMIRMKAGTDLYYDARPGWYCLENWL